MMAVNINYPDYTKAPLLDTPATDLFENLLKGYKMGREPANMAAAEKKNALANQLSQLEAEHKPKEYALNDEQKRLANSLSSKANAHYEEKYGQEKELRQANIDKAKRPGGSGDTKFNSTVANADKIWRIEHPEGANTPELQADYVKTLKDAFALGQEHTQAVTNRSVDAVSGASYDKLPVNEKKRAIGLTTAMGIDPIEGDKMLRSGKNLKDIAEEKGMKLEDLTPMYPLGEENVKQLQKRAGYVNEIKNLETKLIKPLAKYQNKIAGFSLEQVADALEGKNPDEQGQVLAARALQPELVALRLKVAGGNIGIEAIKELQNKSLGNLRVVEGLVDTKTYTAMQNYMTQWLEEAANEYSRTMEDYGRLQSPKSEKTYDLATRSWK